MACNEPSHLDLHCVPFCCIVQLIFPFEVMDVSIFKDGRVHFGNSGMKESVNLHLSTDDIRNIYLLFPRKYILNFMQTVLYHKYPFLRESYQQNALVKNDKCGNTGKQLTHFILETPKKITGKHSLQIV